VYKAVRYAKSSTSYDQNGKPGDANVEDFAPFAPSFLFDPAALEIREGIASKLPAREENELMVKIQQNS
jgi:hypothetical protein